METRELVARLGDTPLAEGLGGDDLRRLAETGTVEEVGRGALLREEGDSEPALVVLLSGEVEVLKNDDDGVPRCLVTLEENTVLGEMALLLDEPASATIRTTRPSTVFVLGPGSLEELVDGSGPAGTAIALSLARLLARRLQRMNREAVSLCEHYEQMLAEAGETRGSERVEDLAAFKDKLLTEWNF